MARSGRPPKINPLKPIHEAVMNNDVATFSVEPAARNDVNAPGPEGMTALHIAAHRGNVEFATELLNADVDIDPINVWGNTPLWVAVMERHRSSPDGSMIRLLLDRGADPNRREGNNSPLELAKMVADYPPELIELLESKSAQR